MTNLALILVFIPFFSVYPFIFNSYVQPLPLFVGWLILFLRFNLKISSNFFVIFTIFTCYIVFLKFFVTHSGFLFGDASVLIAYIVGFLQFVLFLSLFRLAFERFKSGQYFLLRQIRASLYTALFIIIISVPLQLIGPVNTILNFIKPRNVLLSTGGLSQSYRGLSGLMPEPSYVGGCLAILLLSLFLSGYFAYIHNITHTTCPNLQPQKLSFQGYSAYCSSFLASNFFFLLSSLIVVFLAFSPTSILVFSLLILIPVFPFCFQLASGILQYNFARLIIIAIFLLICFIFFSQIFFSQSRLSTYLSIALSGKFQTLMLLDASVADRYASSVIGLFSIFFHPLGLGINAHGFLMSNCTNDLITSFDLMCGSVFNSARSHNAIATIVADGGVVALILFFILIFNYIPRGSAFWASDFSLSFKVSLISFPISILVLFTILPAPLGSPFVWLPLSISVSLLSSSIPRGSP